MIDTHCHLNFEAFRNNAAQVINEAKKAGVTKIIVPGTSLETSQVAINLAQQYPQVYAAVGIHPHHAWQVKNQKLKVKSKLEKLAKNNKVVAIGECGLDYYQYQKTKYQDYQIDTDFKNCQKEIFLMQIELAKKLNLPLIIHNRLASNDILKSITNHPAFAKASAGGQSLITNMAGVFHCFEGDFKILNWALNHNFYLGLTGLITYNQKLQSIVKDMPVSKIIIETDSPYLMPKPLKKTRKWPNIPKNVKIVAKWIAKIKSDSFLNIAKQTTENALRLFQLK